MSEIQPYTFWILVYLFYQTKTSLITSLPPPVIRSPGPDKL